MIQIDAEKQSSLVTVIRLPLKQKQVTSCANGLRSTRSTGHAMNLQREQYYWKLIHYLPLDAVQQASSNRRNVSQIGLSGSSLPTSEGEREGNWSEHKIDH